MEITFYGVRSSVGISGIDTDEYGGNTACVHVRTQKGCDLVFDAGTGICGLARNLMASGLGKGKGVLSLFLSNVHWDRIQGIPFFIPIFIPGNKINIYGPCYPKTDLRTLLNDPLNAIYSPIYDLSNFGASLAIHELQNEKVNIDGVEIASFLVVQDNRRSLVYRVQEEEKVFVYMVELDVELVEPQVVNFVRGAHVLAHDTYYDSEDYVANQGHSSMASVVKLAKKATVKEVVMCNYSPHYDDTKIKKLYHQFENQSDFMLMMGQEGLRMVL